MYLNKLNNSIFYKLCVQVSRSGTTGGTGFFYCEQDEDQSNSAEHCAIKKLWLVTNRHNIYSLPAYEGSLPKEPYMEELIDFVVVYFVRNTDNTPQILYLPRKKLVKKGRIHNDENVDIAMIDLTDIAKKNMNDGNNFLCYSKYNKYYINYIPFNRNQLKSDRANYPNVGGDVTIIGFPQVSSGRNNFPNVEHAKLISAWHENINGYRCFEVDKPLYPGFSGSPVILENEPLTNLTSIRGTEVTLLGIYSGVRSDSQNKAGVVFYGSFLEDIVENGIPCFECRMRNTPPTC